MPKLSMVSKTRNKGSIEQAAQDLFISRGYNGVSVRQIADAAGCSLGNLYTYFGDKHAIYNAVITGLANDFLYSDNAFTKYLKNCRFPDDLETMARSIQGNVTLYEPYFRMMYVDVVEFDGCHIKEIFSNLDEKFKSVLGEHFKRIGKLGAKKTVDPSFAFIAIYLSFYQYFTLTKLFHADNLLGNHSDDDVIKKMIQLFVSGIGTGTKL